MSNVSANESAAGLTRHVQSSPLYQSWHTVSPFTHIKVTRTKFKMT